MRTPVVYNAHPLNTTSNQSKLNILISTGTIVTIFRSNKQTQAFLSNRYQIVIALVGHLSMVVNRSLFAEVSSGLDGIRPEEDRQVRSLRGVLLHPAATRPGQGVLRGA